MNVGRTNRANSNKPVNINISFTINPKNIVNQQSYGNENQLKNKKVPNPYLTIDKQLANPKPKTPQLPYTQRVDPEREYLMPVEGKKQKKTRKRNSVDQSTLYGLIKKNEAEKSLNLHRQGDSIHMRKSSGKSKKIFQSTVKRKHSKTGSKDSVTQNTAFKNHGLQSGGTYQQKLNYRKNLKNMLNKMITNQLSKRSLSVSLPTQHNRTARKKKVNRKKQLKQGKSEHLIRKNHDDQDLDAINRKMIIQKLASLRSMNNTMFRSQQDEQQNPKQRRTIVINTDHSIDCIDEIHQMQKEAKNQRKQNNGQKYDALKVKQTKDLIQYHIAMLNQNMEYYYEEVQEQTIYKHKQVSIHEQFQQFRKQQELNHFEEVEKLNQKYEKFLPSPQYAANQKNKQKIQISSQSQKQKNRNNKQRQKQKIRGNELRPAISSQMTKQQKMISQIQRVKLNQLKKHEVQKWGELLTFIKKSMSQGKANHDQILHSIYEFLQQTKMDLQKQITKSPQKNNDQLQNFTNKFSSNQLSEQKNKVQVNNNSINIEQVDKQLKSISSMSYKDQDYEQQNQQLKLMNLQMIENALKTRHDNLMQKRDRQIANLEDQKQAGKISQAQFNDECEKLKKWTKKQTSQIMQARKNIWKGYNEAKQIIEKSLKSKYFQQESAKKKSMMKCLSEDYLLKNYNYKKLLKAQEQQEPEDARKQQQRSESQSENQQPNKLEKSKQSIDLLKIQKTISNKASESQQQHEQQYQNEQQQSQRVQSDMGQSYEFENGGIIQNKNYQKSRQQQLKNLKSQDDINIIKQRLIDIKNKHLPQQSPQHSQQYSPQNQHSKQYSNDEYQRENEHEHNDINYQQHDGNLHEQQQEEISSQQMKLINKQLSKQAKSPTLTVDEFQRLRHILPQDKQDIFQFIFLDLSIQLYQQPCHQNRIMETINNYVAYVKRQANKKKGVKTNLNVVKQYLKRFTGYIKRAHKNVLNTLDEPVGPTAIQMLKYMHENDDEPAQCEETPSPLVIPSTVFDQFQKTLISSIQFDVYYENDEERQSRRVQFLKNILHIHNKALFDAMNEYLDLLRPFGIWGKPFPWKNSSTFLHPSTQQQRESKLKKAQQKVAQHCAYVCGLLVDKQQSLVGNARLSEDYLQQIKQDRLSRMLASQLVENQERWLFYDDQETQVLVEISTAIYIIMIRQAAHETMELFKKRRNSNLQ